MSRTVYSCRRCQARLGVIRKGRVLTLEPKVMVVVSERNEADEVRVICPCCRTSRTFRGGVVIVPMAIAEAAHAN